MDKGCYNTYTISDSDDSVIIENRRTHETSRKDDGCLSPEEEPEFFLQVIQRQKRKKLESSEIALDHKDHVQKDIQTDANHIKTKSIFVEDPEPNTFVPRTEPSIYTETNNEEAIEKVFKSVKKVMNILKLIFILTEFLINALTLIINTYHL